MVISTTRMAPVGMRIAEQRDGDVAAGELGRHDAGADDGRDQQAGAQRLGGKPAVQVECRICSPRISPC